MHDRKLDSNNANHANYANHSNDCPNKKTENGTARALNSTRTSMQNNFDKQKNETQFWMKRAQKKSKRLIESEELLKKVQAAIDGQKYEKLHKDICSFLADSSSQLSAESK